MEQEPAQRVSRFVNYTNFNGSVVNLDQGKKIICLFAAGCDHCQETAKELTELSVDGLNLTVSIAINKPKNKAPASPI